MCANLRTELLRSPRGACAGAAEPESEMPSRGREDAGLVPDKQKHLLLRVIFIYIFKGSPKGRYRDKSSQV